MTRRNKELESTRKGCSTWILDKAVDKITSKDSLTITESI
jgi:hypothetical protein